jgi:hypothetical protein
MKPIIKIESRLKSAARGDCTAIAAGSDMKKPANDSFRN